MQDLWLGMDLVGELKGLTCHAAAPAGERENQTRARLQHVLVLLRARLGMGQVRLGILRFMWDQVWRPRLASARMHADQWG